MLTVLRAIFIYDVAVNALTIVSLFINIVLNNQMEVLVTILTIFFVQFPKIISETVLFVQDFTGVCAIVTLFVRVVTIMFSIIILFLAVKLVTVFEDDGIVPAVTFLILGVICMCIDAYFTFMYCYYWKYPEQRMDRSDICSEDELNREAKVIDFKYDQKEPHMSSLCNIYE